MKIYPDSNYLELIWHSHPVFLAVEKEFDDWIENTNPANEMYEKYFGDEAIYSKRGAIEQAIEEMLQEANELAIPVNISTFDLASIFQD